MKYYDILSGYRYVFKIVKKWLSESILIPIIITGILKKDIK